MRLCALAVSHAVELAALTVLWPHLTDDEKEGQDLNELLLKPLESSFNRLDEVKLSFQLIAYDESGDRWRYDPVLNLFLPHLQKRF